MANGNAGQYTVDELDAALKEMTSFIHDTDRATPPFPVDLSNISNGNGTLIQASSVRSTDRSRNTSHNQNNPNSPAYDSKREFDYATVPGTTSSAAVPSSPSSASSSHSGSYNSRTFQPVSSPEFPNSSRHFSSMSGVPMDGRATPLSAAEAARLNRPVTPLRSIASAWDRGGPTSPASPLPYVALKEPTPNNGSSAQKLRQLEMENAQLAQQVQQLSSDLEQQSVRMQHVERLASDRQQQINNTEHQIQRVMMERSELEERHRQLASQLEDTQRVVQEMERQRDMYSSKVTQLQADQSVLEQRLTEAQQVRAANNEDIGKALHRQASLERLQKQRTDVASLKKTVESLVKFNDAKERRLEQLQSVVQRYKQLGDVIRTADGRTVNELLDERVTDVNSPVSTPASAAKSRPLKSSLQNLPTSNEDEAFFTDDEDMTGKKEVTGYLSDTGVHRTKLVRPAINGNLTSSPEHRQEPRELSPDDVDTSAIASAKSKLRGRRRRSSGEAPATSQPFQRGGIRATAGPRLGSHQRSQTQVPSNRSKFAEVVGPVSGWDAAQVSAWLRSVGLELYSAPKRPLNGSQLVSAAARSGQLEKDLSMHNPLHRKKLRLALRSVDNESRDEPEADMDHTAVSRWLDDIGLPQHKDKFTESRVDGRVLNRLTVDDLLYLKVQSELHHASIKTAIKVLRLIKFDLGKLKRRPDNDSTVDAGHVQLWTCHRLMDWLHSVDLAEYSASLRGSGVHGALLVHEDRFTPESLAAVLAISGSKSLLRRHLRTQLYSLIGDAADTNPDVPLTAALKVKSTRRFLLLKHKRRASESELDLICPLDLQNHSFSSGKISSIGSKKSSSHRRSGSLKRNGHGKSD